MIFMHPNFVRGERKRCLLMRSIVKRPVSTSTSLRKSSQHGIEDCVAVKEDVPADAVHLNPNPPAISINSLHAFGSSALHLGQQEQSATPSMAQQITILPASSFLQNLAYQELYHCPFTTLQEIISRTASASAVFETSSRMQHHSDILDQLVQQRRQELVRQILSVGMNDGSWAGERVLSAAMTLLPHHSQPLPLWPQPAAVGPPPSGTSFGYHSNRADFLLGRLTTTGNVTRLNTPVVLLLASRIMKSNPSMEPWRALELAKKSLPGSDDSCGSAMP